MSTATYSGAAHSRRVIVIALAILTATGTAVAISLWGAKAVAVVPIAGVAVATVAQPVVGLVALASAIPLEDAVMVAGSTVTKFLGVLVAGAWLLQSFLQRRPLRNIVGSPVVLLAVLFILFASLSTLWAEHVAPTRGVLMRLVMFFALAVVALDLVRSWKVATYLVRALVIGGSTAAVLTIAQYYGLGVRRAGAGISGGINATAIMIVTLLPFAFYLYRVDKGGWRVLGAAYIALAVAAVAVTLSRMSYLVLPLILLLEAAHVMRSRRGRLALALLGVAVVPVVMKYVPVESVSERIETVVPYIEQTVGRSSGVGPLSGRGYHLLVAWEIFQDHPIVGAGINNYGYQFLQYQHQVMGSEMLYTSPRSAHSSYFAILADLGIIGISLWVVFLLAVGRLLYVSLRRARGLNALAPRLLIRALAIAFGAQVLYGTYAEIHKEKLFWLIVGLSVASALLIKQAAESREAAEAHVEGIGNSAASSVSDLVDAPATLEATH